jgi:LmbE family N-acetylglucosaminyl deacetylase
MLVISPHYDDAALSAGQLILGADMATMIVTVCAGRPNPAQSTSFDAKCGFADSNTAIVSRHDENEDAARVLGAATYDIGNLDGQYGTPLDASFVMSTLARCVRVIPDDARIVVAPLGLVHADHVAVADAVRSMRKFWSSHAIEVYAYEDLPARVVWPEEVSPALDVWRGLGWSPTLAAPYPPGDLNTKLAACSMYASQWDEVCGVGGAACIAVPERIWRMS